MHGFAELDAPPDARHALVVVHAVHADAPGPENVPLAHDVAAPAPSGQYEPAGHGVLAPTVAQKDPMLHGFEFAVVLPTAVQKPMAHVAVQAAVESPSVEPYVPAGHGRVVPAACPARQ